MSKKIHKTGLLLSAAVFFFSFTLASCTNNKISKEMKKETTDVKQVQQANATKTDQVIVSMPKEAEPQGGFDPILGWGNGEHVHEPLIQSTLLVTKDDLSIGNDLATGFKALDGGKKWMVTIRGDVKFSNGEPLTAKDVAFTYNMCRDKNKEGDFTMLKEAKALDPTTVEFDMNRPYSPWPYTMAVVGIVPEKNYSENYGKQPIGSGRYLLKEWKKGEQAIFEANPTYYGNKQKMKKLVVLFMDDEQAMAGLKTKKIDVIDTTPLYAKHKKQEGYHVLRVKTVDNRGINLPALPKKEVDGVLYGNDCLSDVRVRKAINIGIDRQKLVDEVLEGYGSPAYSVCDQLPWYNETSKVSYDPKLANKLLDDAGWTLNKDHIRSKNHQLAKIKMIYHPADTIRQMIAEQLKVQLKDLGIVVEPEARDWDTAWDKAQSEPLVWGWGAHSPMELYNIYHTSPESKLGYAAYSPYKNLVVDKYMDEAMATLDVKKSNELWKKAAWDGKTGFSSQGDCPWVWLCNIDHVYFVRDGLNIAKQKIHPHGHGWSIVNQVDEWTWN